MSDKNRFMNPYLAGVILGLVVIASFYLSGRGLGASGAVKSGVITVANAVAPTHTQDSAYYLDYLKTYGDSPIKAWLVFLMVGVFVGGFISGANSNRLGFKLESGPKIGSKARIIFAIIGGMLFGFGAQLGRGCTSGAALSGMAILSSAGFIAMLSIFGSGFIFAYFFRKLWI